MLQLEEVQNVSPHTFPQKQVVIESCKSGRDGVVFCIDVYHFLLDDSEVKTVAFSKQFDTTSLAVAPHYLPFALDAFTI